MTFNIIVLQMYMNKSQMLITLSIYWNFLGLLNISPCTAQTTVVVLGLSVLTMCLFLP